MLGKTYYFDEEETYVADGHVTVIRTKPELYAKYLYYFFFVNFDTFNSQMAEGSTNQTELQRDLLGEMLIPLPPSAEQIQIMKLLDRMCSKIDSIEAEVQSQIDVLEQYKRTVITEAVTKGLIPKGEMQESGIQWIGTMPAHWECIRGKYILKNVQKPVREDDGVITCFRDGEVTLRSNRREDGFTMADKEIGYQGIDVGDLVVHGMDGFAGAIGISDSRGKGSPVLNVLETAQNKRYIMYFLRSMVCHRQEGGAHCMKVEFIESEFWGAALFVAEADFKLAKTKDAEFDSLAHATKAFANLFDVDYTIGRDEYNAALDVLEKNGAVIFTIGSSQYPERSWVEIQVSNNNQPKRVLYADEDGYHLVRHVHYNPKAAAAIRKRHEEERKK